MDVLKVVDSGIISIYEGKDERMLVNARELHEFLESRQDFSNWIQSRIEKYGFTEGEDFSITLLKSTGGRPAKEYFLTLDTAKEIAMLEHNGRGRIIRKYFIECERRLRSFNESCNMKDAEKLRQQAKRLDIMERNARYRQARTLQSAAEFFQEILPDVSMQSIVSEITVLAAGKRLVDLPEAEKLYSAAEVGEMCGVSANAVEYIADVTELKTEEYGMFLLVKVPGGKKLAPVFYYRRKTAEKILDFLDILDAAHCAKRKATDKATPPEEEFNLNAAYL
jgi:anti-repressor protein